MAEFRVISIITQTKNSHPIFLEFDSGTRLEFMNKLDITVNRNDFLNQNVGINYLAFSVGSKEKVDELTSKFEKRWILKLLEHQGQLAMDTMKVSF